MSTDDTTPISAETQAAATVQAQLPQRELALIGTLTGGASPRALLRNARGRMLNLGLGERAGRHRIVGIGEGEVLLSRGGTTIRLKMPES